MPASTNERFEVRQTRIEDYDGIRELCLDVYPFSPPWAQSQIASHLEVFPEGQLVVWDAQEARIVAMAASLVVNWDDYALDDTWRDFTDGGYFRNHDTVHGRTLYGAEIMVHPRYQGQGLGKRIYSARREVAERLHLRRIRAGARLRGYGAYARELPPELYLRQVVEGTLFDPTLSFQLRRGFVVVALVSNYLPADPESAGWAAVIEWLNPHTASESDRAAQTARYARLFGIPEGEARTLIDG